MNLDHISAEFRRRHQWVVWRWEKNSDGRDTKIPYQLSGAKAASTRPEEWCSFDNVVKASGFDGMGFVLNGDMSFLDYDHVLDENGKFKDAAIAAEVSALVKCGAYAELSPSGDGVHVWGLYKGEQLKGLRVAPREAYVQGRYGTVTGVPVPGIPQVSRLTDTTDAFIGVRQKILNGKPERKSGEFTPTTMRGPMDLAADDAPLVAEMRKDPIFATLWDGTWNQQGQYDGDESKADAAFFRSLIRGAQVRDPQRIERISRASQMYRDKWDRPDYLPRTIADALADTPTAADVFAEVAHAPGAPGERATHPNDEWLKRMNARYAVTTHHGKTRIHESVHDHEFGFTRDEWLTREDLILRHCNEYVNVVKHNGAVSVQDVGTAWLENRKRRQYHSEAFLPGQESPVGVLNLWGGLAIQPKRGKWTRLHAHIKHVICGGDPVLFAYIMGWMARIFQNPAEPGQVALVLQGDEGTGKGTFARALLAPHGRHGLHITQPKHLTGAFNQHLRCVKFLFADEAVFAGNPEHRGPLYGLITETEMQIEAKGVDAKPARNVLAIVMATNQEWAVPAGISARRFCVLRVSEKHRQDTEYFSALRAEMDDGGIAAMLDELLTHDLSGYDVFAVPQTEALAMQKIHSLKSVDAWVFSCLQQGALGARQWTDAGLDIGKAEAYGAYQMGARTQREYSPKNPVWWSKTLRSALGDCMTERRLWVSGAAGGRNLMFKGLGECRQAFERYLGQPLPWELDAEPQDGKGVAIDPFA